MLALALACGGCGNACEEVAERLRECCARGPVELREECQAEAQRLEEDGNSDACEAFDLNAFNGCKP